MFENIFKKKSKPIEAEIIEPVAETKLSFDKTTKMLLVEENGVIRIRVFAKMTDAEILTLTDEWDKKYIGWDDKNRCFDRIIVKVGPATYKYTILPNDQIELNRRLEIETGINDIEIDSKYPGFTYYEMNHDEIGSSAPIVSADISDDRYDVLIFGKQGSFCDFGVVPEEVFDVNKVKIIIEEFYKLNIQEISESLDEFVKNLKIFESIKR